MEFELKIDIIANKTDHEASPGCTWQGKKKFSPGNIGVGIQRERGGGGGGLMRPEEKNTWSCKHVQTKCKLQIQLYINVYSYKVMYKVFWQCRQDATIPTIKTLWPTLSRNAIIIVNPFLIAV